MAMASRCPDCTAAYEVFVIPGTERDVPDWNALCDRALSFLRELTLGYTWHLEGPKLRPSLCAAPPSFFPRDSMAVDHLFGTTWYGDSVEDAWLLVWALRTMTGESARDATVFGCELAARVWDDDGDFMLIESAEHLPSWLQPDTSVNRMFLRAGRCAVLCDDAEKGAGAPKAGLELGDALSSLARDPLECSRGTKRYSILVTSAIDRRLAGQPDRSLRGHQHTCVCLLPRRAALALSRRPQGIAQAVHAFFYRGPEGMKKLRSLNRTTKEEEKAEAIHKGVFCTGEKNANDFVLRRLKMNRTHYAQLMQQEFDAPACAMPALPSRRSPLRLAADLGTKVACGLELFYSQNSAVKEAGSDVDGVAWQNFRGRLEGYGYFEGEIEGSRRRRELERAARAAFAKARGGGGGGGGADGDFDAAFHGEERIAMMAECLGAAREPLGSEVLASLEGCDVSSGDGDSWLYGGDDLLARAAGSGGGAGTEQVLRHFGDFVSHVSGHEGAEVPRGGGLDFGADLDPEAFFGEVAKAVGLSAEEFERQCGNGVSAYFSSEDSGSESDGEGLDRAEREFELVEGVDSDDDSDDDDDGAFARAYDEALEEELAGTEAGRVGGGGGVVLDFADRSGGSGAEGGDRAIDREVEAIESILTSVKLQDGLPGPATNLMGMLGVPVPREELARQQQEGEDRNQ